MSPSAPDVAATREAIRGHALDLFSSGGYEATSLRDIAERMGFSKAALWYHYRSKDQLLADLFEPVLAEGDAIVAEHVPLGPGEAAIGFLGAYFDFLWVNRRLLCHVACDLAVLSTTEIGGSVLGHVEGVVMALAAGSRAQGARVRAKAALGALQGPITLADPDANVALTRRVAVAAASAVLASGANDRKEKAR